MIWITVTIALLLSLAALAYVIWPFFTSTVAPYHTEDDQLIELITRKDSVMAAIKDLDFDYRVGKISEEDFQRFDARLRRQAIAYIQQIEKLSPQIAGMDASLEAEISRYRRATNGHAKAPSTDGEPAMAEQSVSTVKVVSTAKARYCTTCGEQISDTHKFCANCGTPVEPVSVAQR